MALCGVWMNWRKCIWFVIMKENLSATEAPRWKWLSWKYSFEWLEHRQPSGIVELNSFRLLVPDTIARLSIRLSFLYLFLFPSLFPSLPLILLPFHSFHVPLSDFQIRHALPSTRPIPILVTGIFLICNTSESNICLFFGQQNWNVELLSKLGLSFDLK